HVACISLECGQVLQVAGVGQLVQVQHRLTHGGDPVQHEIGADEAGAPGHENQDPLPRSTPWHRLGRIISSGVGCACLQVVCWYPIPTLRTARTAARRPTTMSETRTMAHWTAFP